MDLLGGGFIFASELKAIERHEAFEGNIDREAMTLFFRHSYIPAPYSIYKQIKKLEAGSVLEIEYPFITERIYKYWDLIEVAKKCVEQPFTGSGKEAAIILEDLLRKAIRQQMVADVDIGAFLSGGIDSTSIVALAQDMSTKPLKTFTIGYKEENYNEACFAKKTAEYLGTNHTEYYISEKEGIEIIPKLSNIYSEPFADSSQIPTYFVSKIAAEKVKVSLSGDGGDELFCGYRSYIILNKIWNIIRYIPYSVRKISKKMIDIRASYSGTRHKVAHYLEADAPGKLYELVFTSIPYIDDIISGNEIIYDYDLLQSIYPKSDFISGYMLADLQMYHPDDILVKVDRAAMAVSLETRIPLLDKDIVEFALSLPIEYKYKNGISKKILRDILYKYVPEPMMDRPKAGFGVPVGEWCRGVLREWAEEYLLKSRIQNEGILNYSAIEKIKSEFFDNGKYSTAIWNILMFESWMETRKQI